MLGPLALFPLMREPSYAFALVALVLTVLLASRSIAWPVALIGVQGIVIALLGTNPFPQRGITLFFFGWQLLAIGLVVVREDDVLPLRLLLSPPVVMTVALAALMLARLGASDAGAYGSHKLQLFLTVNMVALLSGIVLGRRARDFNLWMLVTLVLAAFAALVLIRSIGQNQAGTLGGRFALSDESNPIQLGRQATRGLLIDAFALLATFVPPSLRLMAMASLPLLAVSLIASGSRGPLLGLIFGLAVLLPLVLRDRGARRRLAFLPFAVAGSAALVAQLVPGGDIERSLSVVLGGGEEGSNGRTALWGQAWQTFREHPFFGLGTGGFATVNPIELYPHNIVLEAGAELGVLGLLLTGGILVTGTLMLTRAWRGATERHELQATALVLALWASAALNAMVSSDISGNGGVWFTFGLGLGLLGNEAQSIPLFMTRRRRHDRAPSRTGAAVESRPGPRLPTAVPPSRTSGGIVEPADGAAVRGTVTVAAEPAVTGFGVASLRIELRVGDDPWTDMGAHRDEAFDLYQRTSGARRHIGIVRSERIARLIASALGESAFEFARSRRRLFGGAIVHSTRWDTTALVDGRCELRAVTLDVAGTSVASAPVAVVVDNTPPQIRLRTPAAGTVVRGPLEITASVEERASGVAHVALEVSADGRRWFGLAAARTLTWDPGEAPDGDLLVRARATDGAGNVGSSLRVLTRLERGRPGDLGGWLRETLGRAEAGTPGSLIPEEFQDLGAPLDRRAALPDQLVVPERAAAEELRLRAAEADRRATTLAELRAELEQSTESLAAESNRARAAHAELERLRALHREQEARQRQDEEARAAAARELALRKQEVERRKAALEAREGELAASRATFEEREQRLARELEAIGMQEGVEPERVAKGKAERVTLDAKRAWLAQLEARVSSEREELAADVRRHVAAAAAFADNGRRVADGVAALGTRALELGAASADLAARESRLRDEVEAMLERERAFAELQERLVDESAAELARARADLDAREESLGAREQRVTALAIERGALEERAAEVVEHADRTAARAAELEALALAADEREEALAERERELRALEVDRARGESALAAARRSVEERESAVEEREGLVADFEPRTAALAARTAEAERLAAAAAAYASELAERAEIADEREAALAAREEELSARAAKLAALATELSTREQVIADAGRSSEARESALAERERAAAEREQRVAGLEPELAAITARAAELDARAAELATLLAGIERREASVAEQRGVLAEREQAVAELQEQLSRGESGLDEARRELVERESAVDERERAAAERVARVERLEEERRELVAAREELARESQSLAEARSAAEARESRLAEQEAAAAAGRARVEEERRTLQILEERVTAERERLAAAEAQLTERERAAAGREAQVARLEEERQTVVEREAELARLHEEAAARARVLDETAAAVRAREAELERAERRADERQRFLESEERRMESVLASLEETARGVEVRRGPAPPPAPVVAPVPPPATERAAPPTERSAAPPLAPAPPARERVAAPLARVEPLPVPAPAPPPAQPVRVAAAAGPLVLWELERRVAADPHPDPAVQEEREALLFYLREYASSDGTLSDEFRPLIETAF